MAENTPTVLEQAMPDWKHREVHQIRIPATDANVMDVVEQLTWNRVPVFRGILRMVGLGTRRYPADGRVLTALLSGPYTVLYRSPAELVIGGVVSLRQREIPALGDDAVSGFRSLRGPGLVKAAINFSVDGQTLSTETRVLPLGRRARLLFQLYWLVIRAGSGIIRRSWLRGVRAEIKAGA